jgi:S1-C subfamily serine protease
VVSGDGYILSKASEIEEIRELSVRVDRESFDKAEIVAVNRIWDVALVKVAAENLVTAPFASDSKIAQGSWVVVNGATSRSRRRVLAGIISAEAREIPPAGGAVLGVNLKVADGILTITGVSEGSGAEEAGLKKDDVILTVEGKGISEIGEIKELLKDKKVGSKLKMKIKRDEDIHEFEVELSARDAVFEQMDRNDMMSGDFSKRRSGFPRVIQHDILANSDTMGGPVLNLKGQVVGMNIARANRAETFAIPVEELRELAKEMLGRARK